MKMLSDFATQQDATAIKRALEQLGVDSSVEEHEGTWKLNIANGDEERAKDKLMRLFNSAYPPKPISFWMAVGFSVSIIVLHWIFLASLANALNTLVVMAIAAFAISLTIINLPIERKRD